MVVIGLLTTDSMSRDRWPCLRLQCPRIAVLCAQMSLCMGCWRVIRADVLCSLSSARRLQKIDECCETGHCAKVVNER